MVVLEMLAIAAIFALSFALLFREKPIEFRLTIKHEHEVPISHLEEMHTDLKKEEEEIVKSADSLLNFINNVMSGEVDLGIDPKKKEDKRNE